MSTFCCQFRSAGALGVLVGLVSAAGAAPIEVIYSEVPGHPSSQVPGAQDLNGDPIETTFKALESINFKADGTQWIVDSRNNAGSDLETQLLLGSGVSGDMLAQEGQPVHDGAPGEVYDFFDDKAGFNASGHYAFGARARNGDFNTKEKVIKYDGSFQIVIQESDPALGLEDAPGNVEGDELFGNSMNSIHLLNDGAVGFTGFAIQNIHSSYRPALFYDNMAFAQSNVTPLNASVWADFDLGGFATTPDGKTWLATGDKDDGSLFGVPVLAVDGEQVIIEGGSVGPFTVDDIHDANLVADGTWFARGDDAAGDDWAVRNGALIAATGDPITTNSTEQWGDSILAATGNRVGDWIVAGETNLGDPETDSVVVLNGKQVVVREGDPVDLNGNGEPDDDAFVGRGDSSLSAFRPDQFFLTDDGVLYFIAKLRDSNGNDLGDFVGGDAFVRFDLEIDESCPEDLAGDDGQVGVPDLLTLLGNWGTDGAGADLAEPLDTVNVADLLELLSAWGVCP